MTNTHHYKKSRLQRGNAEDGKPKNMYALIIWAKKGKVNEMV